MSTYRVITSDGRKHTILGTSAAAAIEEARWAFRGLTVKEIYSGLKQDDVDFLKKVDRDARPLVGYINHDVPHHDPVGEDEVRRKLKPLPSFWDGGPAMFDEEAIRRESEQARHKRDNS